MENPQDVVSSNPWSWQGRLAFACFLFGFIASRILKWNWRTYLPPGMSPAIYLVLACAAILFACAAVVVLFIHRVVSAAMSEYAADRPHWWKWVLLLLATLAFASGPIAFFSALAGRLLR